MFVLLCTEMYVKYKNRTENSRKIYNVSKSVVSSFVLGLLVYRVFISI